MNPIALGDKQALICVYIEHRPPLPDYQQLTGFRGLHEGDIAQVAKQTGNHWRKIFNVYAKFMFELQQSEYQTWQHYRDHALLTSQSRTALYFTPPDLSSSAHKQHKSMHIIMGKSYAGKLGFAQRCQWLTPEFAIDEQHQVIICPYFDYRQLSNIKITQLCQLVKQLHAELF